MVFNIDKIFNTIKVESKATLFSSVLRKNSSLVNHKLRLKGRSNRVFDTG